MKHVIAGYKISRNYSDVMTSIHSSTPRHCEEERRSNLQHAIYLSTSPAFMSKIASFLAMTVLLFLCPGHVFAQSPYTNNVYSSAIKSVEFYNTTKQGAFPIITLGSNDKLQLDFDDLRGGSRNYYYTIEHCDANWNSSNLSTAEYLQSFTEDRLFNYSYSTGTFQKYTHYELKLPNDNVAPKISGNYVLKIYENGNQANPVITRRMYVVTNKVGLTATIVPSANTLGRQTNQKINYTVDFTGLTVQNPSYAIRTFIMQNARPETGVLNTQPTSVRGMQLVYNDIALNDFPGRNEFRLIDLRTLKLNSQRVGRIFKDTANSVVLLGDPIRDNPNYLLTYDNNGKFFILNQDGTDPRTDADYAHVYFTLASYNPDAPGTPYIVGRFNDYRIDNQSKLTPDAQGHYAINLLLKQGVYDYEYVWVDNKTRKADDIPLEGSHFETENDYQLLVYYHPPSGRWDELVGFRELNTVKK